MAIDLRHAQQRQHQSADRENAQSGQTRVDVRITRAESRAVRSIKQFETVQKVAPGFYRQQRSEQDEQMPSRSFGQENAARAVFNTAVEKIHCRGGDEAQAQGKHRPMIDGHQGRQTKNIKAEIQAELRIAYAKRRRVEEK